MSGSTKTEGTILRRGTDIERKIETVLSRHSEQLNHLFEAQVLLMKRVAALENEKMNTNDLQAAIHQLWEQSTSLSLDNALDFSQALALLKQHRRMRRHSWIADAYCEMHPSGALIYSGALWVITQEDVMAQDWVEWSELLSHPPQLE